MLGLIGDVTNSIAKNLGLDDSPIGKLVTGAVQTFAGVTTGDLLTGLQGAQNMLEGILKQHAARVEYFAPNGSSGISTSEGYARNDFQQRFSEAVRTVKDNFDLLDTAAGIGGRDGQVSRVDLLAALANPALPANLKQSCRLLLANPAVWNQFDVGAGLGKVDGKFTRGDVDALAARLAASATTTPSTTATTGKAAEPAKSTPCTPPPTSTSTPAATSPTTSTSASPTAASSSAATPAGTVAPNWDPQFANAVRVLTQRFDLFDTAAGIGMRDGLIGPADLQAALKNPKLPEDAKQACQFLLTNRSAWNQIDVGAGIGKVDSRISRRDLEAVAAKLQTQAPSSPATRPAEPTKPGTPTPSGVDATDPQPSASRFDGMSPEQIVESLMFEMLNGLDGQLVDTAKDLERAQNAQTNAERGTDNEKKATADVNRLQLKLQQLIEKRKQMFELLSNLSSSHHEMARAAISNLGRA